MIQLLSVCLFVLSFPAFGSAPVSLGEAVQSAIQKTEAVPIQESELSQAEEHVTQGIGRVVPNISFQANYLHQDTPTGVTSGFLVPDQTTTKFTLVQPIFHGFADWAELRARKLLVRAAESTR